MEQINNPIINIKYILKKIEVNEEDNIEIDIKGSLVHFNNSTFIISIHNGYPIEKIVINDIILTDFIICAWCDIVIAFWDEGVHYYKPTKDIHKTIKTLAKPAKNVYVVGEIVSYKQGWVEGAIQSVNDFYGYSKS